MFRFISASRAIPLATSHLSSLSFGTPKVPSATAKDNTFLSCRLYSSGNKDYYKILGVSKGADTKEIKKAYRKRALETHPDQGGSKEEFAELAEAYETLSNPEKRQIYDQYGSEAANQQGFGGMGGAGGGHRSAEDIFAEFFRGSGMGGFGDMFGGAGARRGPPTVEPQEVRVRLTLEDVYRGVTKTLRVNRPQVCTECSGHGTKSKTEKPKCQQCNGTGQIVKQQRMGPGMVQQSIERCPRCQGMGFAAKPEDQCLKCHGKGYKTVAQDVTIEIPAGVPSNVTLVVRGEGGMIPGAQPGDLHVHIEVSPHKVFQRRGDDLIVRREVTLAEALLGLHMDLKLLDGRTVNVETTSEQILKPEGVIKIPGEGMVTDSGGRGDVYIFTQLKMPAKLNDAQKDHIKKAFGVPERDKNASPGNTVKARVMRETRSQLEEQKRGVWGETDEEAYTGARRARPRGGAQHQQAECATQ